MVLRINVIEAAAELAEERVKEFYNNVDKDIYTEEENGDTIYTSEAQDIFNVEYDVILEKIIDAKTTPIPTLFNSKHIFVVAAIDVLAKKQVKRYMERIYASLSEEGITDKTWKLGELNNLEFTEEAQGIYDSSKEYYEINLTAFEV